jgi:hypothetical protein
VIVIAFRLVDFSVFLLALLGVMIAAYAWRDNRQDRKAARQQGRNGHFDLTAVVGIREAQARVASHVLFAYLGLLAVTYSPPPHLSWSILIVPLAWVAIQAFMVQAQLRNQIDRYRLRRRLQRVVAELEPI